MYDTNIPKLPLDKSDIMLALLAGMTDTDGNFHIALCGKYKYYEGG